MTRFLVLLLFTSYTSIYFSQDNLKKSPLSIGANVLLNQSVNWNLFLLTPKNVGGLEAFVQKKLFKRIAIQSGIGVLEKSVGKDFTTYFDYPYDYIYFHCPNYTYLYLPIIVNGYIVQRSKFALKLGSGVLFEKIIHQKIYSKGQKGLNFGISYRGQIGFKFGLSDKFALLANLNFTKNLNNRYKSDASGIINYGIGLGIIRNIYK